MTKAPPVALALSPHLDDAVFSAGGTLARLAREGWRVIVATVFTRSVPNPTGFALACQVDKGVDPTVDYMALRRGEDATACARLGVEPLWLPFREAPHRGYATAAALFAGLRADDECVAVLTPALGHLVATRRPSLLLAPQAIGGHVDHLALVQAVFGLARTTPTLWWRDYPYTIREGYGAEPFAEAFAAFDTLRVPLDDGLREARCDAALAYASQLGFQFGGAEALRARIAEQGCEDVRSQGGIAVLGDAWAFAANPSAR